jgi:hypothetical protein
MAVFLQKNESMDALGPFWTIKKEVTESTRQWQFSRVLIHWHDAIIQEVMLKCIIAQVEMAIILQKTKSMDTLPPFLANKKGLAESFRQWQLYRALIHWYDVIIWKVVLKTVIAHCRIGHFNWNVIVQFITSKATKMKHCLAIMFPGFLLEHSNHF